MPNNNFATTLNQTLAPETLSSDLAELVVRGGGEFLVNEETNGYQSNPEIAVLANGQFVVTWTSEDGVDDQYGSGIKARIFNADGTPVPDPTVVTTTDDIVDDADGETSLREALAFANSDADASTITFDASLAGQTITLDGSELVLSSDVTIDGDIDGDDVADITISGNDASRVILVESGVSTLDALKITDGSADSGSSADGDVGGGISISAGSVVTLTNSMVNGNYAQDGGGGVYVASGATANVINSTISGNYGGYEGVGGGILNIGDLTLSNSTLSNNSTHSGGGIWNSGTATLTNATIAGNVAETALYVPSEGGGLHNIGTATLTNTTISGNEAKGGNGGGLANWGTIALTNSTVSGNYAQYFAGFGYYSDGEGAGIWNGGTATLANSIVLGNLSDDENYVVSNEIVGAITSTNSLTATGGETAADVFAALDASGGGLLADNGGPVQTIALSADPTNPALDSGDDTAAPATDATGQARFDVPGLSNNGDNICDLGAFELVLVTVFTGDGDANEIFGTEFSDAIYGNDGFDNLYGQGGNDFIHGGDGNDQVFGGDGADILRGGNAADHIEGGAQNDTLRGGPGNDGLYGGDDNDLLLGGVQNDRLFGDAAEDSLRGGAGEDRLVGGLGADRLFGGADADTFVYLSADDSPHGPDADRISDFTLSEDLIGMRHVIPGAFDFVATAPFSGIGPEIRIVETPNGHTRIFADVDGDASADMRVVVIGVTGLTESDFIL
ncbi:choice-of-anchor Q domain-containing protein [Falsiphaeobacter marinintestinus]|uniref:choice-of-anchor Q domain-containing protein n=1 Tax=Falsiphaeobacter marinintestinus TaxID=1492905 RepID=UPI0011B83C56|nr:choice-of-anchor Q domain-containing protein [Phaeobacter marinintestinus]